MAATKFEIDLTTFIAQDQRRGRGAVSCASSRFDKAERINFNDGWDNETDPPSNLRTEVIPDQSRTVLTRNTSPDVPFDRSVNPYRGCEHGCIYCFARPTHAYLGMSPGLDFETKLFAKFDAAHLLRSEISKPSYQVAPIAYGTNTDPYQPIERDHKIMREILELMVETRHPITIVTKGHLITRDIDLLGELAKDNLVRVFLSVTSLDHRLSRVMEPRASAPARRLDAISKLRNAGITVGALMAPVIPAINDHELECIFKATQQAGAEMAGVVLLRLPIEVKTLFKEWLNEHFPDRAERVMSRLRAMRNGQEYDSSFGQRMRGSGPEAALLATRFKKVVKRLGLNEGRPPLACNLFRKPSRDGQLDLF